MRLSERKLRNVIRSVIKESMSGYQGQSHPKYSGFHLIYDSSTQNRIDPSDRLGITPDEGKILAEWASQNSDKDGSDKLEGLYVIVESGKVYAATPFSIWLEKSGVSFKRNLKDLPRLGSTVAMVNYLGSGGYL